MSISKLKRILFNEEVYSIYSDKIRSSLSLGENILNSTIFESACSSQFQNVVYYFLVFYIFSCFNAKVVIGVLISCSCVLENMLCEFVQFVKS